MSINTTIPIKSVSYNGTNIPLASSGEELPAYMSAKYFTFSGNACNGYVGDNTLPEIIIPKSYSIDSDGNFIDGDDYQVTAVNTADGGVSQFAGFENTIILLSNITSIGLRAFFQATSIKNIIIPDSVTNINNYTFAGCTGLTTITIPNSVISIGVSAFEDCDNLTNVVISNSLLRIDNYLFYGCTHLNNVVIPDSVKSIGMYSFQYCKSLTNIKFSNSITSIGDFAFRGCSKLNNVTLPNSIMDIRTGAFYGCISLTTMTVLATTPPTLVSVDAISTATTKIYIPAGTLSAYQSATNWSNFASLFEELPA